MKNWHDDSVTISNECPWLEDCNDAMLVAKKLKSGCVYINGNAADPGTPFGGFRQSGNGREGGVWGLEEYLEVKTVTGWN